MSAQEQVAKLEALLARVTGRRSAPRSSAVAAAPAPVEPSPAPSRVEPTPSPAPVAVAAPPPVAAVAPPPVAAAPAAQRPVVAEPKTPPPASVEPVAQAAKPSMPPGADLEVEVEEEMAEVDLEGLDEEEEGMDASLSDSVADLDVVAAGGAKDDEEDEELPASSRRPIQIQPPLEEVFNESAKASPSHPVPPESGRQIAAPPVMDFEGDLSGVRSVAAADAAPHVELKAEVTRPVVATASPAVFHGEVPAFQPATFGELLDATLGF
jgi:hypothetical protein